MRSRAGLLGEFLDEEQPDVLALQETKCSAARFPADVLDRRGYSWTHFTQGGRNGVVLASTLPMTDISHGFGGSPSPPFDAARLAFATIDGVRVGTLYAPNGKRRGTPEWQEKLAWFELLRVEVGFELSEHEDLVLIGDYNVCPTDDDVYDPIKKRNRNLLTPEERRGVEHLQELGLTDIGRMLHGADAGYTWYAMQQQQFEKGKGYRLDLALGTDSVASRSVVCQPANRWRSPALRPSDHVPLMLDLS